MKNAEHEWKQRIQIKRLLFGLIASIGVMLILASIGASLVNRGVIQEEKIELYSAGAVLITSLIGSIVVSAGKGNGNLLQILAFSISYILINAIVNISFFDGRFPRALPCVLAVIIGTVAALLIKAGKRQGKGIKKIRVS